MQSSLRARRESPASGPETAVDAGRGSGSGWFPALFRIFSSKAAAQDVPAPDVNPLLAFPSETVPRASETVPRAESAPIPDAKKRPVLRPSPLPRQNFLRPALIVLVCVAVPSLGVLAIRRFPIPLFTASAPRSGKPDDCDAARRFGGADRWRATWRDATDARAPARRAHDHHPERRATSASCP